MFLELADFKHLPMNISCFFKHISFTAEPPFPSDVTATETSFVSFSLLPTEISNNNSQVLYK